jgi:hypothetical protein
MEILKDIRQEKFLDLMLEDALYCVGVLGIEKTLQLYPQLANEIHKTIQNDHVPTGDKRR